MNTDVWTEPGIKEIQAPASPNDEPRIGPAGKLEFSERSKEIFVGGVEESKVRGQRLMYARAIAHRGLPLTISLEDEGECYGFEDRWNESMERGAGRVEIWIRGRTGGTRTAEKNRAEIPFLRTSLAGPSISEAQSQFNRNHAEAEDQRILFTGNSLLSDAPSCKSEFTDGRHAKQENMRAPHGFKLGRGKKETERGEWKYDMPQWKQDLQSLQKEGRDCKGGQEFDARMAMELSAGGCSRDDLEESEVRSKPSAIAGGA
ncbi:hypothetical protein C8R44DRAFT_754727 [Mycena epipterygia]|nr:hypothetical protein C8R44DRAFT_754727 [Mycena epipterygia]